MWQYEEGLKKEANVNSLKLTLKEWKKEGQQKEWKCASCDPSQKEEQSKSDRLLQRHGLQKTTEESQFSSPNIMWNSDSRNPGMEGCGALIEVETYRDSTL
jgi:hypothetical protein